ncbi:MAG: Nif3-like dinuclear metal center hexameric protein [Eubacteriales bacterium]|nr:Nif3-like dinuclear metal center hexameric protein [Eubacteriales bacterium]
MKICELTAWLEEIYPPVMAEEWDNVGFLVGDDEREVTCVFLALDLTEETLLEAERAGAELIITHHPMIFSGIKRVSNHSFTGRRILSLIQKNMGYYAMHTNYDILGMADHSAQLLGLKEPRVLAETFREGERSEGLGRVGDLESPMTLREYALFVKERLCLGDVKVYGNLEGMVERAAVCTGSGKSLLSQVERSGAQVYVTGDIDHHTGIDAVASGLFIIDAGHYGTEYIFMEAVKKRLAEAYPHLRVVCAQVKSPYSIL